MQRKYFDCLPAKQQLPAYTIANALQKSFLFYFRSISINSCFVRLEPLRRKVDVDFQFNSVFLLFIEQYCCRRCKKINIRSVLNASRLFMEFFKIEKWTERKINIIFLGMKIECCWGGMKWIRKRNELRRAKISIWIS